jgi:sulfate adenylyltransferase subunit 2
MKAFRPARMPFPLLHVDTTWKFREMIEFRDAIASRLGVELNVHINEDGVRRGINPVESDSVLHTHVMKTKGLRQALDRHKFEAAIGGARRDEEKSRAKERVFHESESVYVPRGHAAPNRPARVWLYQRCAAKFGSIVVPASYALK